MCAANWSPLVAGDWVRVEWTHRRWPGRLRASQRRSRSRAGLRYEDAPGALRDRLLDAFRNRWLANR